MVFARRETIPGADTTVTTPPLFSPTANGGELGRSSICMRIVFSAKRRKRFATCSKETAAETNCDGPSKGRTGAVFYAGRLQLTRALTFVLNLVDLYTFLRETFKVFLSRLLVALFFLPPTVQLMFLFQNTFKDSVGSISHPIH